MRPQLFSIAAPEVWETLAQATMLFSLGAWRSSSRIRAPSLLELKRCARNDYRQLVRLSTNEAQETTFMRRLLRAQLGRKNSVQEQQAKELIASIMTSAITRNRSTSTRGCLSATMTGHVCCNCWPTRQPSTSSSLSPILNWRPRGSWSPNRSYPGCPGAAYSSDRKAKRA